MEERPAYPRVPPERLRSVRFRHANAEHLMVIKERMRNIQRGGVVVETMPPPDLDAIAEVSYEAEAGGLVVQAVGLVRWVDTDPPSAGIQFIRVSTSADAPAVQAGTPPATRVYAEGPCLVVTGELGSGVHNGFVSCWAKTLNSDSSRLIIDLSGVTRISSMGVGLLMGAHMDANKQEKSLTIKVPVAFQRMLSVAGVDKVVRFVYVENTASEVPAGLDPGQLIGAESAAAESASVVPAEEDEACGDWSDPVAEAEAVLRQELEELGRDESAP